MKVEFEDLDYELLATKIAEKLKVATPKVENEVWGPKECAQFLGFKNEVYFRDRLSKEPDFPAPIPHTKCKWLKANVIKWAEGKGR